jgi:hypothetical protein
MVTEVRPEQYKNVPSPMLFTLFGMVTLVKLEHPENAAPPMLFTLFGMVTEVRPEHLMYLQVVLYQLLVC